MGFGQNEAQLARLPIAAIRKSRETVEDDKTSRPDIKQSEDDPEAEEMHAGSEEANDHHPGSLGGPATLGVRFLLSRDIATNAVTALRKSGVHLIWCILDQEKPEALCDVMVLAEEYDKAISTFQKARFPIHPLPLRLKQILEIARTADREVTEQLCSRSEPKATKRRRVENKESSKVEEVIPEEPTEHGPPTIWDSDDDFGLRGHLPDDLLRKLKRYQKQGVAFVRALGGRAINADEMGLGKTLQAICVAMLYQAHWPALVICPSSLKSNWRNEINRWAGVPVHQIVVIKSTEHALAILSEEKIKEKSKKSKESKADEAKDARAQRFRDAASEACIYIIAYDLLVREPVLEAVDKKRFKVIIADESHCAKNRAAKRTQCLIQLCAKAPHVMLLSGTPSSSPEQWFSQLQCVQSGLLPPFWIKPSNKTVKTHQQIRDLNHRLELSFASRWCDPFPKPTYGGHFQWDTSGCARAAELYAISSRFVFVRRTVRQVLQDMPSKEREKIIFDIPESERERIEKEMCVMRAAREKQPHVARRMIMEQYNDLPRLKEPVVRQYLKDLLVDGEIGTNPQTKVLLFYHHREMRNILVNEVEKAELEYIEINGDVPSAKRQPLVDTFQTDPKCRVAILSITAAGTGLNMQAASFVVMCELFWTPSQMVQAEARAHRMGVKWPVFVKYLVAEHTLDDVLWRILTRKQTTQGLLFDGVATPFQVDSVSRPDGEDGEQQDKEKAQSEEVAGMDDISRALIDV
jgi:SWI/SNF-related matrix-associated actin-dependent regulator 1 of chromatin subfamily A